MSENANVTVIIAIDANENTRLVGGQIPMSVGHLLDAMVSIDKGYAEMNYQIVWDRIDMDSMTGKINDLDGDAVAGRITISTL